MQLSCEKPCRVLEGDLWKKLLQIIQNTIIFIDEDNAFIETKEFAEAIQGNTNYFVIVTRENLEMLPISVTEVYGIKSSGRYGSLIPVYHEMYHVYDFGREDFSKIVPKCFMTEDSNSGFEFFSHVAKQNGISCISANGKSNIYGMIVGEKWSSWERFFSNLLVEKSKGSYLSYTKKKLNGNYLHEIIQKKILSVLEGIKIKVGIRRDSSMESGFLESE